MIADCNKYQIAEHIEALMQKQHLNVDDQIKLEQIDTKLTWILVSADCHCQPLSSTPWSLVIQKAYLWSLKLTAFRTHTKLQDCYSSNCLLPQSGRYSTKPQTISIFSPKAGTEKTA